MTQQQLEKYLYKHGYIDGNRVFFTAALQSPIQGMIGNVVFVCLKNDTFFIYNGIQQKNIGEEILRIQISDVTECKLKMGVVFSSLNLSFNTDRKISLTNIITSRRKLWEYCKNKKLIN